jgi:hypothetical protein
MWAVYDWLAMPVIAYLYAVDRAEQVPEAADEQLVASLRDDYRRKHLGAIISDDSDGTAPEGNSDPSSHHLHQPLAHDQADAGAFLGARLSPQAIGWLEKLSE